MEDKYDEKTRGLIAAAEEIRKKYQDVERQLNDIDRDIKNIKEVMEKDFGKFLFMIFINFYSLIN